MSVTVALLQGIAGGILIVLLLAVVGGGLLFVGISGRAAGGEGPERPGRVQGRSLFPARALCVIGLGSAVVGAFFVSIGTNVVGMMLGAIGYYLGARVFGVVIIVLSLITIFIGLAVGQDPMPGAYDEIINGVSD